MTEQTFNLSNILIGLHVIHRIYERAISAVFINDNVAEWFQTTIGVRHSKVSALMRDGSPTEMLQ